MQRYLASELPNQAAKQTRSMPNGGQTVPMPQAVQHAIGLGTYVLEQRGREGAALYLQGLQSVLPHSMIETVCRVLQLPVPQRQEGNGAEAEKHQVPPQQKKQRSEPDMEMVLRMIQMMKGESGKDLSSLFQMMNGKGK